MRVFYTLFSTKGLENHTLYSGTYPYSQYMGVPPHGVYFQQCRSSRFLSSLMNQPWANSSLTPPSIYQTQLRCLQTIFQYFYPTLHCEGERNKLMILATRRCQTSAHEVQSLTASFSGFHPWTSELVSESDWSVTTIYLDEFSSQDESTNTPYLRKASLVKYRLWNRRPDWILGNLVTWAMDLLVSVRVFRNFIFLKGTISSRRACIVRRYSAE